MSNWKQIILAIILSLLFCSACGSGTEGTGQADPNASNDNVSFIKVSVNDSYYESKDNNIEEPPVWYVKSGTDVVAEIVNNGSLKHNWAIVKKGHKISIPYNGGEESDILLYRVGMLYKNNQTMAAFTAPEPGEYLVICTVTDHYPYMQGVLRVEE